MPRIAPSADWMTGYNDQAIEDDDNSIPALEDAEQGLSPMISGNQGGESSPGLKSTRPHLPNVPTSSSYQHPQHHVELASSFDPEAVRATTLQLSNMVLHSRPSGGAGRRNSAGWSSHSTHPTGSTSYRDPSTESPVEEERMNDIQEETFSPLPFERPNTASPPPLRFPSEPTSPHSVTPPERKPSGIARLLASRGHEPAPSRAFQEENMTSDNLESQKPLPPKRHLSFAQTTTPRLGINENTPLLSSSPPVGDSQDSGPFTRSRIRSMLPSTRKLTSAEIWKDDLLSFTTVIPAVIIGLLLNILDGLSYGIILFPASEIFSNFGSLGVSMFFVTTVISQLVYSLGGSAFAAVNGSMMIEVVPFFAILAQGITEHIGEDKPQDVIATTMVAFALSSVLTGVAFLLLGGLKWGALIGFFPRHILVGCIGGIGWFLIETGFEVSAGLNENGFEYTVPFFRLLFMDAHIMALWLPAFLLAVLLKLITSRFHHQLVFPMYFLAIPVVFYIVVAISGTSINWLRKDGWVFDIGQSEPWWKFYTYFDLRRTSIEALWATMPTQLALLFFNVLHPPLNVPALAVSLDQEVDLNRELVAHGYSNTLAGLLGTVPNYEVYINTVLFYRVGGGSRLAGLLLALATVGLLLIGTAPIGYIPIMLVGALIFVLGIDLVKEALWDTRNRVSRTEYITIVSIMVTMTVWDFVIGVLFGILISCVFFVVQSSQSRSIRALYTGESAMSSVRRPSAHRAYIREVAKQTTIVKLQGFLFFGTCTYVEEAIRKLLDPVSWSENPIRFLIVDLSLVPGVDVSSAEALVRIQRLLASKQAFLVLCGFTLDGPIGRSLSSVELLKKDYVEMFEGFGEALEWTENAYLRAYFLSAKSERDFQEIPIKPSTRSRTTFLLGESFSSSPRRMHVHKAGRRTLSQERVESSSPSEEEPYTTLKKAFSSYASFNKELLAPLGDYLLRVEVMEGTTLWQRGDSSDALYIIESGVLRATYSFSEHSEEFIESMVSGALTGELTFLSGSDRNATVTVEKDAVLWKLSSVDLERMENEKPEFSKFFVRLVLKAAKIEYDSLLASLAARQ